MANWLADRCSTCRRSRNRTSRTRASYTIVGQSLPRVDIPAKVTGQVAYVHDLRLEGMVHARVVMPPSYGAKLKSVDTARVEKMPGVKKVVRDGNFLAVIADREFRAVKAMEVLTAAAQWDERETMPSQADFYSWLKQQKAKPITVRDDKAQAAPATKTLEAEYLRPYQMHAAIGPACAVAQFVDGNLTVWSHAQGMSPLRQAVSQLLKLPPERVRCIHMEGAGCYGHNGADDAAADAAYLAVAYPGAPVRVQWSRDQEHQWEPYGAGMVMGVKGSLDADGNIVAWDFTVWTDTHSTRPGGAGATLPGQHIAAAFARPPAGPGAQPNGSGDRNIIPLYKIPNLHLLYNFIPHQELRVSALRGLGAYANVFAIESFMDELATEAGIDPLAFRLKHLTDPRAIDVVKLTAEKFGWQAGAKLPEGRGRGIAFARYKNLAGYCAVAIELEVEHETGRIRLIRAVVGGRQRPGGQSRRHQEPDRRRHRAVGELDAARGGGVRPHPHPEPRLVELSDPAFPGDVRKRRRARHRPPRRTLPRHRRSEPGPDGGGDRQCGGECDGETDTGVAVYAGAGEGGDWGVKLPAGAEKN